MNWTPTVLQGTRVLNLFPPIYSHLPRRLVKLELTEPLSEEREGGVEDDWGKRMRKLLKKGHTLTEEEEREKKLRKERKEREKREREQREREAREQAQKNVGPTPASGEGSGNNSQGPDSQNAPGSPTSDYSSGEEGSGQEGEFKVPIPFTKEGFVLKILGVCMHAVLFPRTYSSSLLRLA